MNEKQLELIGRSLTFEKIRDDLNNSTPLEISKKLIDYELHDQQSSIEVMNKVYEEFESADNIINNLVHPMLLGVADGLVKHPKLKGTFRKTNITPSRLVKEVNSFTYSDNPKKDIDEDVFLTQAEKSHYGQFQRKNFYDTKSRNQTRKEKDLTKEDIQGKDMDHINPINTIRKKYKNNPYLYRDDLEKLVGMTENENYEDASLNRSKGDKTWKNYIQDAPKDEMGNVLNSRGEIILTVEEQEKKLELEKEATKGQNKEAAKLMAKNIGLKGLGDIIILLLKPIWFEIKDMFNNGILSGFETSDKIEAFILRLKRVGAFIKNNIINTLADGLKDVVSNFVTMLVNAIVGLFTGIFQKIAQIISDGFMAIKEAFIIMMKPESEISQAQKADAITKIIASAVVPILIFSFEETLSKILFIGDVATIIVSGLATTLVVWLLNEIDLFSVKDEKRLARIKEIFALRIENIKRNTDIFKEESLKKLAKQKLQFTKIIEDINHKIENNEDVNTLVYKTAEFMDIELNIKSNDDFIAMLQTQKVLTI